MLHRTGYLENSSTTIERAAAFHEVLAMWRDRHAVISDVTLQISINP